jgi:hypothetical protein
MNGKAMKVKDVGDCSSVRVLAKKEGRKGITYPFPTQERKVPKLKES